ncbi:MAG: hypothetical protein CUR34_11450 [Sediminibacterium sp.]|nr:MAG: hypothetical protein CUR34_11450 [Sediminibacterium sp.] [Sediminibacterium sp. FEMGT703S]
MVWFHLKKNSYWLILLLLHAPINITPSIASDHIFYCKESKYDFENDDINIIDINSFDISKTGTFPSFKNTLLLNQNEFVKKFGKPQKKLVEYSELDDANMDCYVYQGMKAWFMNKSLESIALTSSNYCLNFFNNKTIKVGDNIDAIVKAYPKSWQSKRDNQVFVGLKNNQITIDINLIFEYDSTTRKITEIHFGY